MERICIPELRNRISPVFDVAEQMQIIDIEDGKIIDRQLLDIEADRSNFRVDILVNKNIDTVICGAISENLAQMLIHTGIEIYPWVSGNLEDILQAYASGQFSPDKFFMPGCRRSERQHRRQRNRHQQQGSRRCRRRGLNNERRWQ